MHRLAPVCVSSDQFKKLGIRKKKTRYEERSFTQRIEYLSGLRSDLKAYGSSNIVYVDESGFEEQAFNPYAWSARGKVVYGQKRGNHKKNRTNLIMAQRADQWLAPVLFEGSCDHRVVESFENPKYLDKLIQTMAVEAIEDYDKKVSCCGGALVFSEPEKARL